MSGLIWAGIGQGIANAGRTAGDYMMRAELDEERQRERAELQRERIAAQERQDALYRRTVDQQGTGRSGGGGGGRAREYTPEEQTLMAVESGQFASQADVDKFRAATKSGDFSGYQREVTRTTSPASAGVDPYNMETVEEKVKEYPPGFAKEVQAKARVLANIARESVQGKDLKDVNEGRQKDFELGVGQGVLSGEMSMGRGSGAVASMAGKPIVDVKEGTAFNQYTGTMQTTEKGKSEIRENNAQTAKYSAEARKVISEATGALQKGASQEKLATMLSSLNKLAESTDLDDAGRKRVQELQMSIVDAMKTNVDGRSGTGADKGKLSEADAHAQAQRALATGKITLDDVNKRLTGAGYKPLPADAGKAGAPKPSPAPAPTAAPAPRDAGLSGMSTRDLRRLAATQGHARQAAAQAELARREAEAQTWEEEARTNRGMMP